MNVLLLRRWLHEEGPALIGARLRGPRQLDAKSVVLELSTAEGRIELLVSVREDCPTLAVVSSSAGLGARDSHSSVSSDARATDTADSGFVKALQYQLAGHTLIGIQQDGFERSVSFRFHNRDQYGRDSLKQLVVELAGRASNAYLISERGMVVSMLKRIPPGSNRVRRVVTGKPLPPPPPLGKFIAAEADTATLEAELAALSSSEMPDGADTLRELLTRRIAGGEVKLWPALETLLPVEHSVESLYGFIRELQSGELTDRLFGLHAPGDANRAALAAWEASRSSGGFQPSADASGNRRLEAAAAREMENPALQQIQQQLALAERADELEALGLALLAAAETLDAQPGAAQSRLTDLQQEQPDWAERIDSLLSAADNAQRLVNAAQRLRRGKATLERKLEELSSGGNRAAATSVAAAFQPPDNVGDKNVAATGQDISAKLEKRGVKHLRFTSSNGMPILCGTSDSGNDGLLRHFGNARHIWLHARDFPGSHVIILSNGQNVPQRTLEEAATIAAYYSKGQKEHEVEVSYVPMKHVRKPKGAKPGLVHISNEKVISVRPERFEAWRTALLSR